MRAVSPGKKSGTGLAESTDWSSLMTDAFFSISSSSNGLAVIPSSVISVITALKDSVPFSEQPAADSSAVRHMANRATVLRSFIQFPLSVKAAVRQH